MPKYYEPTETFIAVKPEELIEKVKEKRREGRRLLQMFATYTDDLYELTYCFDSGNYNVEYFKVTADKKTVVPSVGEVYPYATPYENEAIELFGVKINVPEDGFRHKLYKIAADTPYVSDFEK